MPRDLGQLLHDTAVTPSAPIDPGALVARGRRRRRRRRTAAVVGSAAVVALTAGLAVGSLITPEGPDVVLGPPVREEPSQTPEDAARDGVIAEVAALSFAERVQPVGPLHAEGLSRVVTDEGVWVASRLSPDAAEPSRGCRLGDVDGSEALYRRDVVCDVEYGEVLLLDHAEQRILRAFPLPGLPPQTLAATDDAVYCARQGDGGLPDSMLCRIDRQTYDWIARVFPAAESASFPPPPDHYVPDNWAVDEPVDEPLFATLAVVDDRIVIGGRVLVDPDTLELGEHVEREAATVAPADIDRPLLVHGEAGIRRVAGGDDQRLWDEPVVTALPDLRGGVVFQDPEDPSSPHEGWGFGTIRWLAAGADAPAEPAIAGADERPVLHAVVDVDGEPTVLFTRRSGDLQGEEQVEILYARALETGVERELGVTGRLESGLESAGMADGHLVINTCHLHCSIRVVPPGTAPDADGVTELDPPAARYGLDVEGNLAGYVELTPSDDLAHATPALVLRDLARDERTDIRLPTVEARAETVSAQTDLAPDLTAALIHLTWHDVAQDIRERRTLLVDRLDTEPRVRLLDTDHTLRFDARP